MLSESETKYDPAQYHSLGTVEDADERVRHMKVKFRSFLREAHSLAVDNNVQASLGALLLHRHWDCPKDALMVETPCSSDAEALVTEAHSTSKLPAESLPSRYRVGSTGELIPLEYSTDEWVAHTHSHATIPESFGIGFRHLLESYDLEETIGLALLARFRITRSSSEEILLEENFDGKSVVSFKMPDPEDEAKLITTAWPIGMPLSLSGIAYCSPECTIYLNCRGYCRHWCQVYCIHNHSSCVHHHYNSQYYHEQNPRHENTGHS